MENLEKIIAKILEEANDKAKFILDEATAKVDEINNTSNIKVNKAYEVLDKEYDEKMKLVLDRVKSQESLRCRNIVLDAKEEAIKIVFENISKALATLSNEEQCAYVKKALAQRSLEAGEKILIPERYNGIDINHEYELSSKINTGFVIEKDGVFENYTIETLVSMNEDEIEAKIQEYLFN